jgi:hypothetical protein
LLFLQVFLLLVESLQVLVKGRNLVPGVIVVVFILEVWVTRFQEIALLLKAAWVSHRLCQFNLVLIFLDGTRKSYDELLANV